MPLEWLNNPKIRKTLKITGYCLFGITVFFVSLILNFPDRRLKSFAEGLSAKNGIDLTMDSLSLRGIFSIKGEGLKISIPGQTDSKGVVQRSDVYIDEVYVSIGLFRLMFGDIKGSCTAKHKDGYLGPIHFHVTKENIALEIESAKDFPFPTELSILGMRFAGKINGRGNIHYSKKDGLFGSSGRLELSLDNLVAIKPTLKSETMGSVTLTDVNLGKALLVVNLDKRSNIQQFKGERKGKEQDQTVIQAEKVEIDGNDVKALVEPQSVIKILQGKGLGEAQINIEIAFALSEEFFNREIKVGNETSMPNKFLKTLLDMSPQWKSAKSGNYWGVVCQGTLRSPTCVPKGPSIRGGDFRPPPKEVAKDQADIKPPPRVEHGKQEGGSPVPSSGTGGVSPPPATPPSPEPSATPENETSVEPIAPGLGRENFQIDVRPVVVPTIIGGKARLRANMERTNIGESPSESHTANPTGDRTIRNPSGGETE